MLYSRVRRLIHKNIISFFLKNLITQNVRMDRVRRIEDGWAALTEAEVRIFSETSSLPFPDLNLPGYVISWMATQILVVTPPPARRLDAFPLTTHASRYQVHFMLFLFLVSDFRSCIDRCQRGLQVNIQHLHSFVSYTISIPRCVLFLRKDKLAIGFGGSYKLQVTSSKKMNKKSNKNTPKTLQTPEYTRIVVFVHYSGLFRLGWHFALHS